MAVFYSEQSLNFTKSLQSHILLLMLFDGYRYIKCTNMVVLDTSERDITYFANAKALEEMAGINPNLPCVLRIFYIDIANLFMIKKHITQKTQ